MGTSARESGKFLDPDTTVELLGLQPEQEVVFQGTLRGEKFFRRREGYRWRERELCASARGLDLW